MAHGDGSGVCSILHRVEKRDDPRFESHGHAGIDVKFGGVRGELRGDVRVQVVGISFVTEKVRRTDEGRSNDKG